MLADNQEIPVVDNSNLKVLNDTFAFGNRLGRKGLKNAKKVYEFVKGVSDECLGKKVFSEDAKASKFIL